MATGKCCLKLQSVCLPKQGWLTDSVAQRESGRAPARRRVVAGGGGHSGPGGTRGPSTSACRPGAATTARQPRGPRSAAAGRVLSAAACSYGPAAARVSGSGQNGPLPARRCGRTAAVLFPLPCLSQDSSGKRGAGAGVLQVFILENDF